MTRRPFKLALGTAAILAVLGGAALLAHGIAAEAADPAASDASASAAVPHAHSPAALRGAGLHAHDRVDVATSGHPAPADLADPAPQTVDVCGVGRIGASISDIETYQAFHDEPVVQASRARLLARLAASPDPYQHALSIFLRPDDDEGATGPADRRERVARLAAASNDPRLVQLATQWCAYERAPRRVACERLDAARWTTLAPDNGLAWIYAIGQSRRRGDVATGDRELSEMGARATHVDEGHQAFAAALDAQSSATDLDMVAETTLYVEGVGRLAAFAIPLDGVFGLCRAAAGSGTPGTQAACLRAGHAIEGRSDTPFGLGLGRSLVRLTTGDRAYGAGTPDDQLALVSADAFRPGYDCAAQRAMHDMIARTAQVGQAAALREWRDAHPSN